MPRDPLSDNFELALQVAQARGDDLEREFVQTTGRLFSTPTGRRWLVLAMARTNFMGSVFDAAEDFQPLPAAHRDGTRALLSEILNAVAAANQTDPDPEE